MTVYRCGWRQIRGEVELWILDKPHLRIVAKSFFLAQKRLRAAVREKLDDWSPYFAFWPLRPPKAREELKYCDDWVLLTGTSRAISASVAMSTLFKSGLCAKCETPKGKRTQISLAFSFDLLKGADMGTVGSLRVVSGDFVNSF